MLVGADGDLDGDVAGVEDGLVTGELVLGDWFVLGDGEGDEFVGCDCVTLTADVVRP